MDKQPNESLWFITDAVLHWVTIIVFIMFLLEIALAILCRAT